MLTSFSILFYYVLCVIFWFVVFSCFPFIKIAFDFVFPFLFVFCVVVVNRDRFVSLFSECECVATIGGNKSKYKIKNVSSLKLTRDHSPLFNDVLLDKELRGGSKEPLRRLRGMTVVIFQGEELVCDFPVYQHHVFSSWLKNCGDFSSFRLCSRIETIPYELLRSFCLSYNDCLVANRSAFGLSEAYPIECEGFLFQVMSGLSVQTVIFLNRKICGHLGFTWRTFLFISILEEIHKWFFGIVLPVAELAVRIQGGGPAVLIVSIWPFLMHLFTLCLFDFWTRVAVHFVFNVVVKLVFEYFRIEEFLNQAFGTLLLSGFTGFDQLQFVNSTILLIEQVIAKDVKRFIMTLISCGWAEPLINFLRGHFNSVDDFFNYLTSFIESSSEELESRNTKVEYTSGKVISLLKRFLPKFVSDSPAYSAVITLVSCLLGSFAFSNLSTFIDFLPLVDFSKLSQADLVATAVEASINIVAGIKLAFSTGDFKSFFYDPKKYVLKIRIARVLGQVVSSVEENELLKKECDELLETCARSLEDHYLTNQCVPLEIKKNAFEKEHIKNVFLTKAIALAGRACYTKGDWSQFNLDVDDVFSDPLLVSLPASILKEITSRREKGRKFIRSITPRRSPIVLWMMGSPGVGKTEAMMNMARFIFGCWGQTFDEGECGYVNLDDKYPAETVQEESKVIVINDLTGDHSQDTKSDRISLGVVLQSIMDSTPLKFKSSTPEAKSTTFRPELVFVNSNEEMFSTCENTLRLERRFFANAIIASYEIRAHTSEGMKNVEYNEYVQWTTKKRNDQTYVQLRLMVPIEKRFTMTTPRGPYQHVSFFYKFLHMYLSAIPARIAEKAAMDADCCPCGVGYNVHFDREDKFVEYSDRCVAALRSSLCTVTPPCQCGLPAGHSPTPLITHRTPEELKKFQNSLVQAKTGTLTKFNFTGGLVEAIGWLAIFGSFLYAMWKMCEQVIASIGKLTHQLERSTTTVSVLALESLERVDTVIELPARSKRRALAQYYKIKAFILDYQILLLLLPGALLAYTAFREKRTKTTKIILRENVDPNSLEVASFRQEVNYPLDVAQAWNKTIEPLRTVSLRKIGVGKADLEELVRVSTYEVEFVYGPYEPSGIGFALSICPSYLLINHHYLYTPEGVFRPCLLKMRDFHTSIGLCDVRDIYHEGELTDVCLVRNPTPTIQRNLIEFFAAVVPSVQLPIKVVRSVDESMHVAYLEKGGKEMYSDGTQLKCGLWSAQKQAPNGECGLGVVAHVATGAFLLGTVSFRASSKLSGERQGGCVLTFGDIKRAMESDKEPHVMDTVTNVELTSLHPLSINSEFRSTTTPFIDPIGSTGAKGQKFQSSFKKTDLYDLSFPQFSKPYGIIHHTHGVVEEDGAKVYKSAFKNTMSGIKSENLIDSDALRRASTKWINRVVSGVHEILGSITLSPLTLSESFFGRADLDVGRCNFNSSVGPEDRHYQSRNGIFSVSETGVWSACSAFRDKVSVAFDLLRQNCTRVPHISGSYKDEIRSSAKIDGFFVRLFYTVDLYNNTLSRMYLMPIIGVLLRFPYLSYCFGKLNSGSKEWDTFKKYLDKGAAYIDLDFSFFDISHGVRVIRETAYVFYCLALMWYQDEESARVCYVLVYALCVQIFEHKGDFALKYKGLPSGHIVTLILNSIVNVMLMMVAFEKQCPECDFFAEVFPGVVGDDNIAGVSARVKERFNLRTLQPIYAVMGYKMTDAKKSLVVEPFVDAKVMQFVKRTFRWEAVLQLWVAPLDTDSIWKMLAFWTAKNEGGVSYVQRMCECLDVAQREMFLHGKVALEEFQGKLEERCKDLCWTVYWYPFDELVEKYLSGESFMNW